MHTNGKTIDWKESPAGQQVMATFSEEKTLLAIEKLLNKVDALEHTINNLKTVIDQGPGMVAMVGDMVDESYRQADNNGVNIDERLKNALTIAEKLTSNEMVEKLDSLLNITNQAPGMIAMLGDMVDEEYRQADVRGVSIDERLKTALMMAERLTDPSMTEKFDALFKLADQAPGLAAMTTDIIDEGMKSAISKGLDPHAIGNTMGIVAQSLCQASKEPPKKVGVFFGVMKAFGDPDRQKALGFMMNFLKYLGKKI